ncbi:hypothetical protein [Pelomonas sp. SE-A7]|uniref:hypothetical protein n=1 Tax=Pelomonas sp. SE-A7 TaxID=3054953 RepID=UPI00259C7A35|nr:hypothetical protein [Pelomonas sp. SE-A7]MDM4765584.1 hypothetical protein [Pelomonas sp. SE-A7]
MKLPALFLALLALTALPARAQSDWTPCAEEGQTCRVKGEVLVRFGANGSYAFKVMRDAQACTVDTFGSDPLQGVRKRCELSSGWRQHSSYRTWWGGNADRDWVVCASEGDYCRVSGSVKVRYGADGRYAEHQAGNGGIACNNGVFGDPSPGIAKQCAYRRNDGPQGNSNAGNSGLPWSQCAREGGYCSFRGPGMLRYGAEGRYVYREANNGIACNNESFGTDPRPGESKRCELLQVR